MPKWNKAPKTTQNTLRYTALYEDGICEIVEGVFSVSFAFSDISYQIAGREEQERIFEDYCGLLNYLSQDLCIQVTVRNTIRNLADFHQRITLPYADDALQEFRDEYNHMITRKSLQGDNSIEREKYITVTFMADSHKQAVSSAARIKTDLRGLLKKIGSAARDLSGTDRVRLLQSYLRESKYEWSFRDLLASGGVTKDYIAPDAFDFSPNNHFSYANSERERFGQVLYLNRLPADMEDKLISSISELECELTVSLYVRPIAQDKALDLVKSQRARMDLQRTQEQQRNIKNNMPVESLPFELQYAIDEAEELIDDLQKRNQRLFRVTMLVYTVADSLEGLADNVYKIKAAARKCNCELGDLVERQEEAINSILPLGACHIDIERNLTTAATAVLIPFTTQELLETSGTYIGTNALSHNLLMLSRESTKNGNAVITGVSGSGKSFLCKKDIAFNAMRHPNDEFIIIDPDNEYEALVNLLQGQTINISAGTETTRLNPFDMDASYGDDDNPLFVKSEFVLSMCEAILGELTPYAKSILDQCVRLVYEEYFAKGMKPEHTPTLADFNRLLKARPEEEAHILATSLELYVSGSLSTFAHKTNVDIKRRILVYNLLNLGPQLRALGMLIVLDQVWNRVLSNHRKGIRTWVYADEMQEFFRNEYATMFFTRIWRRFRKRNAYATGMTQNVEEILENESARFILANSEIVIMLDQAKTDREELASLLGISEEQMQYITNADAGNGLIRVGAAMIPFEDDFPKDTVLYQAMTTKPQDMVFPTPPASAV